MEPWRAEPAEQHTGSAAQARKQDSLHYEVKVSIFYDRQGKLAKLKQNLNCMQRLGGLRYSYSYL